MVFLEDTVKKQYGKAKVMYALFLCESCNKSFELVKYNGKRQKFCRECGLKSKHEKLSITMTRHGGKNTRLYRIWSGIKDRCINIKSKDYIRYGRRGIKICPSWANDFSLFREWSLSNGYSDNLSIDRIDNNLGYNPDNCRWATNEIQSTNKRNSIFSLKDIQNIKKLKENGFSFSEVCKMYPRIQSKRISNHFFNKKDCVESDMEKIEDYKRELNSILSSK